MAVCEQFDPRLERLCINFWRVSSINFHNVCNECPFICILYANVHSLIALMNFNLGTVQWLVVFLALQPIGLYFPQPGSGL
jgi:hypothetical protein